MSFDLRRGDCLTVLRAIPAGSVDALVTDPPAGIKFMGKDWDNDKGGRDGWIAWLADVMRECRRALKPGAHALVWALPRTSHWTATAIEDAGFEIRDRVSHLFGSGFPKSHNLEGAWDGWGTALKPACEDWWLARNPLAGTVAANAEQFGTGALNIDGCRIGAGDPNAEAPAVKEPNYRNQVYGRGFGGADWDATKGRWPANLALTCCGATPHAADCPVAELDRQSGESTTPASVVRGVSSRSAFLGCLREKQQRFPAPGDSGGASRFFYVAKPGRDERDQGCDDLPDRPVPNNLSGGTPVRLDGKPVGNAKNIHPTVKPVDLMRWLCRLITPPGGVVLDPFMGSGTTGIACSREGFSFIGIERDPDYLEIARRRIVGDAPLLNRNSLEVST